MSRDDVSEVRAELRAHRGAISALAQTLRETRREIAEMHAGSAEMRRGFAPMAVGFEAGCAGFRAINERPDRRQARRGET